MTKLLRALGNAIDAFRPADGPPPPSAPKAAATCARAVSIRFFAARPSAWTEDGFPTTSIAAIIAAFASARIGVVAFQSR